ncbi:MAG: hypothetical protein NVS3B10_11500 [Polyangiales bacterium]
MITPSEADRARVHAIIYEELCLGQRRDASRDEYRQIASALIDAGAEGIVFGCTEIGMLLASTDVGVPVFDTTALHARAAVDRALEHGG